MTAKAEQINQLLLGLNPYEGFPTDQFAADEGERPEGWGARHWVFEEILRASRPSLIIEVGSWKGASAVQMALLCKDLQLDAALVCVDTWLGSPEHILKPRFTASLKRRWGYPQLYHSFLANVIKWGCADMIVPFPNTSENAAVVFNRLGLKADVIYIDAAHEYEAALRDYNAYWELLNDGGYLIGDDYISWEGVTKAADEFAQTVQSQLVGGKKKFVVRKGAEIPGELQARFASSERKRLAREMAEAETKTISS
jgi:predicted O-methyltransferase YrrM